MTIAGSQFEEDARLVSRVASGDRVAYAALVRLYAPRFVAVAVRLMGDQALAEDMVQDAFIKLWTKAGDFDPLKARFTTWFHRILVNRCLDEKRKRRPDQLDEGYDAPSDQLGADDVLAEGDRTARLKAALAELPERQAAAMVLTYLEGHSNQDAAVILDIGVKALESLLVRARRTLKQVLADDKAELLSN